MFLSEDIITQVGTLALVPQIVSAVRVPVIAAGGIGDARGVRAAMALGAAGVQVGTAYLLCPEATTTAIHRAALKSEAARVTALTNLFSGRPAALDCEPSDAGAWPDEPRCAGVSAGGFGHCPVARVGREPRQQRLFSTLVRAECKRLQGGAGCGGDARACRRNLAHKQGGKFNPPWRDRGRRCSKDCRRGRNGR